MRPRISTVVMIAAAAAGLWFSGWSTADFVEHLDRQTHALNCSFVPGLAALDASANAGCKIALMSPHSSWFRHRIWGGLPIALPGMAVFAYLLYRGADLLLRRQERERDVATFLVVAWLLPVLTSCFYGYVAVTQLGELCKLCLGIYGSSAVGFGAALAGLLTLAPAGAAKVAVSGPDDLDEDDATDVPDDGGTLHVPPATSPWGGHLLRFAEGVLFVAVPCALYVAMAPDFSSYIGGCGTLAKPEDPYGIRVPVGPQAGGKPAIEVLDPLCPACAGMEKRLAASGLGSSLNREAVLFPLDKACNWMIGSSLHPGACSVSEAVLCAGDDAEDVLSWAFEHGEEVRTAAATDATAGERMVLEAFPKLRGCVGSAGVKQRLNRSLRWIVSNRLPVLTPQLYVDGVKLCDDDMDLGFDWSLTRLLAGDGEVAR